MFRYGNLIPSISTYAGEFYRKPLYFRLLADLLGFAGAIGIQIIVSSLQQDISEDSSEHLICGNMTSIYTDDSNIFSDRVMESDTMTISQFLHNRLVAAVIILLASLFQGAFSQVFVFNQLL